MNLTGCGNCVDLNIDAGELNVTSLWNQIHLCQEKLVCQQYKKEKIDDHLRIGTRLVVLKICKLGILLLAELMKTGGIFDEGAKPLSPL